MTFSVAMRDPHDGALGAATATAGPAVGGYVLHAEPGVGIVVTQGYSTNTFYGSQGLRLLGDGLAPDAVIERLVGEDSGRARRQTFAMAWDGNVEAWTGHDNEEWCGHRVWPGCAVAGNRLAGESVLDALETARVAGGGSLETRLLAALAGAAAAGGDRLGIGSAALVVVCASRPPTNIRVDHGDDPIGRLAAVRDALRDPAYQTFLARIPRLDDPARS